MKWQGFESCSEGTHGWQSAKLQGDSVPQYHVWEPHMKRLDHKMVIKSFHVWFPYMIPWNTALWMKGSKTLSSLASRAQLLMCPVRQEQIGWVGTRKTMQGLGSELSWPRKLAESVYEENWREARSSSADACLQAHLIHSVLQLSLDNIWVLLSVGLNNWPDVNDSWCPNIYAIRDRSVLASTITMAAKQHFCILQTSGTNLSTAHFIYTSIFITSLGGKELNNYNVMMALLFPAHHCQLWKVKAHM